MLEWRLYDYIGTDIKRVARLVRKGKQEEYTEDEKIWAIYIYETEESIKLENEDLSFREYIEQVNMFTDYWITDKQKLNEIADMIEKGIEKGTIDRSQVSL